MTPAEKRMIEEYEAKQRKLQAMMAKGAAKPVSSKQDKKKKELN